MNTELIEKEFDSGDVSNRPGSYGKLLTYISYPAYVRRMNEVFDYEWSSRLERLEIVEDEYTTVVSVTAAGITKTQAGGKKISRNKDGKAISIGDDIKSAISNSFKKCCQMFGIGLYLVGSDEGETVDSVRPTPTTSRTNGTISEGQLKLIKDIRSEMGMSGDSVQEQAMEMFKLPVTELNRTQASTFINALKIAKQNGSNGNPDGDIPF